MEASLNGSLDGLQLDNTCDVIGKSEVVGMIKDLMVLVNEAQSYHSHQSVSGAQDSVPYQKCPKCDGQGIVLKPPYAAGDHNEWVSTSVTHQCDVCNGEKIIPQYSSSVSDAVEFAEWIRGQYGWGNIAGFWYLYANTDKQYTTQQLYELFLNRDKK